MRQNGRIQKFFGKRNAVDCLFILLISAVGFIIYSNSFGVEFQFDDFSVIVQNPVLRNFGDVTTLFKCDPSRFLTHLTFALNYHFDQLNPSYFHVVNLIMHLLCTIAAYYLLQRTFELGNLSGVLNVQIAAFICSLIFLVHPIQTESVTYVVQRSTLLSALCLLVAMLLYLENRRQFKGRFYFLSWAVVLLGTMTKPNFIILPLIILLYEVCFFNASLNDLWKEVRKKGGFFYWPYIGVLILVPFFLLFYVLSYLSLPFDLSRLPDFTRLTPEISRWQYFLTQTRVIWTYLRLLVFPVNQSITYDYPLSKGVFEYQTSLACLGIILILVGAVFLFKKNRIAAFGIFWFFIALFLESSIFPMPDILFEHRLYLAVIGFAVILCVALRSLVRNLARYYCAIALIIFFFSIMTYARNFMWLNELAFWQDVAQRFPHSARAHNNLGRRYEKFGKLPLAIEEYGKALAIDPKSDYHYMNLAGAYLRRKDFSQAENIYQKAIARHPNFFPACYALGETYFLEKNYDQAILELKKAISFAPNNADAYNLLGVAYVHVKNFSEAEKNFQKTIELKPNFWPSYMNLAGCYTEMGKKDQAGYFKKWGLKLKGAQKDSP